MDDLDYVLETIDPWLSKYLSRGAESLSEAEALGVGVWLLETEVNNGGFDQYYFNTGGTLALATVHFLKEIGAKETASLLAAANADLPTLPLPAHREGRKKILDKIGEYSRFSILETEFYSEKEDRIALLAKYFRKQRSGA